MFFPFFSTFRTLNKTKSAILNAVVKGNKSIISLSSIEAGLRGIQGITDDIDIIERAHVKNGVFSGRYDGHL